MPRVCAGLPGTVGCGMTRTKEVTYTTKCDRCGDYQVSRDASVLTPTGWAVVLAEGEKDRHLCGLCTTMAFHGVRVNPTT